MVHFEQRSLTSIALMFLSALSSMALAAEQATQQDAPRSKPSPVSTLSPRLIQSIVTEATQTSCVRFLAAPYVAPQPISPTHYYSIMPSTINLRDTIRNTVSDLERFTLQAAALTASNQASPSPPAFWDTGMLNAVMLKISAQESPSPRQIEILGETELHLPHGAIIREVSVGVRDNSGKQDLVASFQTYLGNGQGGIDLELQTSCLPTGTTYSKLKASNLAIPFDARVGHFVSFMLVPAKTLASPSPGTAAAIAIDLISIGYTIQ